MNLYPTPRRDDYQSTANPVAPSDLKHNRLNRCVHSTPPPPPDASRGGAHAQEAVRRLVYPTPRTQSLCGGTGSWDKVQSLRRGGHITEEEARAMTSTHGQLNPDWVEWLMGWPVGWTDADLGEPRDWLPLPDDPADLPPTDPGHIPRTTTLRENRASRIKALGNGQVPLCAAVALETMLETFSLLSRETTKRSNDQTTKR